MDAQPGTTVEVTTTYLHIPGRDVFRPSPPPHDPDLLLLQAREPLPAFYRFLYGTVGHDHYWLDRLAWSEERLHAHLTRPEVTLLVLYVRGTPAGYVEMDAAAPEPGTEIAYFGLFREFQGRGLGKHLLSTAVRRAFDDGAGRVWVHTCSLDGPHALATYQGRGFVPYKTLTHTETLPQRPADAAIPRTQAGGKVLDWAAPGDRWTLELIAAVPEGTEPEFVFRAFRLRDLGDTPTEAAHG